MSLATKPYLASPRCNRCISTPPACILANNNRSKDIVTSTDRQWLPRMCACVLEPGDCCTRPAGIARLVRAPCVCTVSSHSYSDLRIPTSAADEHTRESLAMRYGLNSHLVRLVKCSNIEAEMY
jgi:hypothetical protein